VGVTKICGLLLRHRSVDGPHVLPANRLVAGCSSIRPLECVHVTGKSTAELLMCTDEQLAGGPSTEYSLNFSGFLHIRLD
jgi:hypothetical protein